VPFFTVEAPNGRHGLFRENTSDINAGLEVAAMSPEALKLRGLLEDASAA
jgi:isocitrate dehydrogenase